MKFSKTKLSPFFHHGSMNLFRPSIIINTYLQLYSTQIKYSWHFGISQESQFRKPSFWQPYWIDGVIEPGPKTKALRILILFGSGRCWSKEYQKNPRKFKICIIMHKICILCIFLKMHKNHFSGHFRWFQAFLIFSPNFWFFWTCKNFKIYAHFMFSRKWTYCANSFMGWLLLVHWVW